MASPRSTPLKDVHARHLRTLLWASLSVRAAVLALVYASSFLPLFDTSPSAVLPPDTPRLTQALLRWDAFHFGAIARGGYVHEQQWAFLPGLPLTMRWGAAALRAVGLTRTGGDDWEDILHAGAIGALVCSTLAPRVLYALSVHHLRSPRVALLASLLFCIPSSPATLFFAPYNEPYFAYFSYKGMLACAREQYLHASVWFALATAFRSNGVLLTGFILWGLVAEPVLFHRRQPSLIRTCKALVLVLVVVAPFFAHQLLGYRKFCTSTTEPRPWCANKIPSIYTYAQATYWNVGFLRYWTVSQAPNIIIALPVLTVVLALCGHQLRDTALPAFLRGTGTTVTTTAAARGPFEQLSLTPYMIHSVVLSGVLLFASHTQIALRVTSGVPTTYWAGAWLVLSQPRLGRAWVRWSVVWGALSVVLWTAFLPPA